MRLKVALALLATFIVAIECQDEKEWWRTATFYQVYPRSFMDTTGNGIGDLKGIIKRLDHLKDAGFDTFWLSPIFASPQFDTGYDVSDYYKIEPDYGTMEDFDALIAKARSLGLRVMLDFIPNHTSHLHEWFIKSKNGTFAEYRDYYTWHNGTTNPLGGRPLLPNNWISVFGGPAWTWAEERQQYYLHQFYPEQPDLNYRNREVVNAMSDMLIYYMDKGVAGFRLDAINHLFEDELFRNEPAWKENPQYYDDLDHIHTKDLNETFRFVYSWRKLIDDYRAQKNITADILLMTEAYASTSDTMRYYRDPTDENTRGAHMPFNFQLIFNFFTDANAKNIQNGILEWRNNMPTGETANWVMGSHDHSRVASRVKPEAIHLANTIVQTLPGASINYYGEEIGMHDNPDVPTNDNRNKNRTPMQWNGGVGAGFTTKKADETWLKIHPNYMTVNLQAETEKPRGTYKYFQSLTALRRTTPILKGEFNMMTLNDDAVLAYTRNHNETSEGYLIVINTSGAEQHCNFTMFDTFGKEKLHVVTAAPNSRFDAGDIVERDHVILGLYDAVVFDYTSAASSVVLSITLLLSGLLAFLFN